MKKPVRKVRRFVRRTHGKGPKGKGKGGKRRYGALQDLNGEQYDNVFFGGNGESKGYRPTSGKGKGRRKNPIGSDGEVMKCTICDSEEHFKAVCPRNSNLVIGTGSVSQGLWGATTQAPRNPVAYGQIEDLGPVGDLLYYNQVDTTAFSITEQQNQAQVFEPRPSPWYIPDLTPQLPHASFFRPPAVHDEIQENYLHLNFAENTNTA